MPLLIITKGDRNWFILVNEKLYDRAWARRQCLMPNSIAIKCLEAKTLMAMNLFDFLKIPVEAIWPVEPAASAESSKAQA